ncbi:hypothetical protein AB0I28_14665 [Phytomonospora sp. NPDC050363]|uniref:hypothetical protein n=1 Tax=Phytomonospora sp. NPDC050363 TaxID=3155642 RepID=UPI0033ED7504
MTGIEPRYRALLRLYPRAWRDGREEEMVATYLDSTPPERTRPSMRDGLDVAGGALRTWLRTTPPGLPGGARIAGIIGLSAMGLLAAMLFFGVETSAENVSDAYRPWGPFHSPAALCWLLWMAVSVAGPFLPGTWSRRVAVLPAILTSLLILNDTVLISLPRGTLERPQRIILLAAVTLGATALLHRSGGVLGRLLPPMSTVAGAAIGIASRMPGQGAGYHQVIHPWEWLRNLGVAVAAAAVLTLIVAALLRRAEGAWAFLLLGPTVLTLTNSEVTGYLGFPLFPDFAAYDLYLLGVGVAAAVIAAVRIASRLNHGRPLSGKPNRTLPPGPGSPA